MNNLSIVILNYNSGNFLLKCLESIEKNNKDLNLDIWIVDNDSKDESIASARKKFPKLNYILEKENQGFARGNNLGLKKVKNEFVLILNPDTEIFPDTLEYMVNFMNNHPDVGASTCKVELANGKLDPASHRGFPTPLASFLYFMGNDSLYHLSNKNINETHEVDAISGSFFLTRKSILDKVGPAIAGFDEDYFMYAEDLDLCFKIKKAGYKIMFVPNVKIIHYKGVSSGIKSHSQEISTASEESKLRAFNSFYETMKIFYRKNLSHNYNFFINWLVYLAIDLKWFLAKRTLQV